MRMLELFLSGFLSASYAVAALFFLRFWRDSRDRLFAFFAAAFALLLIQRVAISAQLGSSEDSFWFYVLRLLAFLLIIAGVVDKNRAARSRG